MNILLIRLWLRSAFITAILLVVFLSGYMGWIAGAKTSRSEFILLNAGQVVRALEYFNSDQGHYPTVSEFEDVDSFGSYIYPWPAAFYKSDNCSENILYKNIKNSEYELWVCLPKASGGFSKGWELFQL